MKEFFVNHQTGEVQKGLFWAAEKPKANLVIATGMQEYAGRYKVFAEFLNENGYNVYVLDALGQGLNAESVEKQQIWPKDGFFKCVDGLKMTLEIAKENGGPIYLFGHSMGSFMVQSFIQRYPGFAEKIVLCGSNGPEKLMMAMGTLMANALTNKKNWNEPCKFLENLATGGYGKKIENRKTDLDWLSVNEENVRKYIEDPMCGHANTRGFFKGFMAGMNTLYRNKNLTKISTKEPILIIAGEGDPVGKFGKGVKNLEKMYKELNVEHVECIIYPNMRHEVLLETEYEKVFKDVLNFLEK